MIVSCIQLRSFTMASSIVFVLIALFYSLHCAEASSTKFFYHSQKLEISDCDLASEFLTPQNNARAKLGLPLLTWDPALESYAKWWANERATKGNCQLQHSHGPHGENIFWGSGKAWTPAEAVKNWVDEEKYYHYESNSCDVGQQCGHYTQIVWKATKRAGCARVTCTSGDVFMTCNYDPPGNYIGQLPY